MFASNPPRDFHYANPCKTQSQAVKECLKGPLWSLDLHFKLTLNAWCLQFQYSGISRQWYTTDSMTWCWLIQNISSDIPINHKFWLAAAVNAYYDEWFTRAALRHCLLAWLDKESQKVKSLAVFRLGTCIKQAINMSLFIRAFKNVSQPYYPERKYKFCRVFLNFAN